MKRLLITAAVLFLTVAAFGQWRSPYATMSAVPAFHDGPPTQSQPPILSGKQLESPAFQEAWQKAVYKDAAKVSTVLYQLPCYCRCDVAFGHTSLRSCFEGMHGAECDVCAKEGYYAYKMSREGKSVQQIRTGIEHGEYKTIELSQIQ